MIRCEPKGMFSWNFDLEGEGHDGVLEFNMLGEGEGRIEVDRKQFEIEKHGLIKPKWSLTYKGETLATAQKSNAFTRTFEILIDDEPLLVRARSGFGRRFALEQSGELLASFAPANAFTRRATIRPEGPGADFLTLAFSFWLVVLNWRRAANSDGVAAGA